MIKAKVFFNARICDGTGVAEIYRGYVVIGGDGRIADTGSGDPPGIYRNYETVDVGGLLLTPGFIDVHSHSDLSVFPAGGYNTKSACGVTAEIVGNCGLSAFPVSDCNREHLEELWSNYGRKIGWCDYQGYLQALREAGVRQHIFSLLGHNTLRAAAAGYEAKELTADEKNTMDILAQTAFRQGVCGFSTGLVYVPGCFAEKEEIAALLAGLAEFDPVYVTHLRSEGNRLCEALTEAVDICRAGNWRRLHISHFKTAGVNNYGKLDSALDILYNSGLDFSCDTYCYDESLTQLSVILPGEWESMPDSAITRRLQDSSAAVQLRSDLKTVLTPAKVASIRIAQTPDGMEFVGWNGRKLADICQETGISPADAVIALLRKDSVRTLAAFSSISRENMERIVLLPFCSPGSDENARAFDGSTGRGHPRGAGNPAEFLALMQKHGVPLHKAVWKLTGFAARTFRLPGIGTLAKGNSADILLWDPDKFRSTADFSRPLSPPEGMEAVYCQGELVGGR